MEVVPKAENFFIVCQTHTKMWKGFNTLNIVSLLLVRRQLCLFNLAVSLHVGHAISTYGMFWNLEYEKAAISRSRAYQLVNKGLTPSSQSAFYTKSVFYAQSAVHSPQSAVCGPLTVYIGVAECLCIDLLVWTPYFLISLSPQSTVHSFSVRSLKLNLRNYGI